MVSRGSQCSFTCAYFTFPQLPASSSSSLRWKQAYGYPAGGSGPLGQAVPTGKAFQAAHRTNLDISRNHGLSQQPQENGFRRRWASTFRDGPTECRHRRSAGEADLVDFTQFPTGQTTTSCYRSTRRNDWNVNGREDIDRRSEQHEAKNAAHCRDIGLCSTRQARNSNDS
jgi:hypothetical protein